jgi:flagellin FlaB
MKRDNAFTGLEAAIVLIAFVVVAAVFSYVLLGAGFFATQKAQEVTYAGIQQTTSNMFLVGQIYGDANNANGILTKLNLNIGVPEGGQAQNVSQVQLLLSNDTGLPTELIFAATGTTAGTWNVTAINGDDPKGVFNLYPGDKAAIEIFVDTAFKISSKKDPAGDNSKSFTLEIKPRIGASYLITKTLSTGYRHGPLY